MKLLLRWAKNKTRGSWVTLLTRETVPINKHICGNLWLRENIHYLLFENWMVIICIWVHSTNDVLCQVWLKLVRWFWRTFLTFVKAFLYFVIISPWKTAWPFIWTYLNSLHPSMLCSKFGWTWPGWFSRRRWKCAKFTDGLTDNGLQAIWKAHLSFQLRWAMKMNAKFSQNVCDLSVHSNSFK